MIFEDFDFRKLFPVSYWWCEKKNNMFNGVVYYIDLLIWTAGLLIVFLGLLYL